MPWVARKGQISENSDTVSAVAEPQMEYGVEQMIEAAGRTVTQEVKKADRKCRV